MLYNLARLTTLAFFLILVAAGLAYWHVDSQVVDRLKSQKHDKVSGIYSQPLDLYSGKALPASIVEHELDLRQYKKVSRPSRAGEYFQEGSLFEIYIREFYHPIRGVSPETHVLYHSEKGLVENDSAPELEFFSLEPVLVSALGTNDVRASSFKELSKVPEHVIKMVLAAEDHRFYEHFGIDPVGILRAAFENLVAGRVVQGGSTVTQQLAKNTLFTPKRSLSRKLLEVFAALSLEQRYSKDEILEMYLNEVYLGQEGSVAIHGFPEAAKSFYKKPIEEISISQAALLAGIIKAPSYYSPRSHYPRAIERMKTVLSRALELGFISKNQYSKALQDKIVIADQPRYKRRAPYFEAALMQKLDQTVNTDTFLRSGAQVYSGINLSLQTCAQEAVRKGFEDIIEAKPAVKNIQGGLEVGLVSIESFSGLIRAWVGGRNYGKNQFDHVYQAKRQIGSTVKPFVYLTALDRNSNDYKPAKTTSILRDAPYEVKQPNQPVWRPENYDKKYLGDVTLRYALEKSLNIPAVYVAMKVGIQYVARTLERFHVASSVPAVPAIALGALDTTLLDLTSAYAALANGGRYVEPRMFISVVDSKDRNIVTSVINEYQAGNEGAVFITSNILQGVIDRGTGNIIRRKGYTGIAAGKTGTSNDTRDSWFIGYTPTLATGVWVGNDENNKTGLTGASGAAVIWSYYMQCAEKYVKTEPFLAPADVVYADIDPLSGKSVSNSCPVANPVKEVFIKGTVPASLCDRNQGKQPATPQSQRDRVPGRQDRKGIWELLFG